MLAWLRRNATFANVCSFIALTVALGTGSAYAANTIFSGDIVDGEVKTPDIAIGAVDSGKVKNYSLNSFDIQAESLGSGRIAGLTGGDITDNALTGADIDESSLTGLAPRPVKIVRSFQARDSYLAEEIARVGPWIIRAACAKWNPSTNSTGPDGTSTLLEASVSGPGAVQMSGGWSLNDGAVTPEHRGIDLRAGTAFLDKPARPAAETSFRRVNRTVYLHHGDDVAVLEYNAYADSRYATRGCVVVGHVVDLS